MADRTQHERVERLLRERPAVAQETASLRLHRAALVGQLRGYATALRLARLAGIALPFIRRWRAPRTTRATRGGWIGTLLRQLWDRDAR